MVLHIHISEIKPDLRKRFLENEIKGLSIDYAFNAVMGHVNNEEVKVVDFSNYFRVDNRNNTYNLYRTLTEIIIEIIPTKKVELHTTIY
jgi:hypothetical protein